jgi:hypothetical protein
MPGSVGAPGLNNPGLPDRPFGHRVAPDGVHLEPDPAEQSVLAAARCARAAGASLRAIAARLAADGVVGRTGRPLGPGQIRQLLDAAPVKSSATNLRDAPLTIEG